MPTYNAPEIPDEIPDTCFVDGLVLKCKCGHLPHDHSKLGCIHSDCICGWSVRDLTPLPHGSSMSMILPDGRLATLYTEIYGYKILIGPASDMTGGDVYIQYREEDIGNMQQMMDLFSEWDGYGYPKNWYRMNEGNGMIFIPPPPIIKTGRD